MSPTEETDLGEPPADLRGELRGRAKQRRQTLNFFWLFGVVALIGFVALGNWQGWWTIGGRAEAAGPCPVQIYSEPDLTEVLVLNGTERTGLAAAVGKELKARGFILLDTGTAEQTKPLQYAAVIRYGPAGTAQARTVAKEFNGKVQLRNDQRDDETLTVLLGEKYTTMVAKKKAAKAIALKPEAYNCIPLTTPAPTPSPS